MEKAIYFIELEGSKTHIDALLALPLTKKGTGHCGDLAKFA